MAAGPCLNPSCKSHGRPHPNCMCYQGQAKGGEIASFCSQNRPHTKGCQYYAEGGDVQASPVEQPSLIDQAIDYAKGRWDQGGQDIHNALESAHTGNYAPIQDMAVNNAMSTVGSTARMPTVGEFQAMGLKPASGGILSTVMERLGLPPGTPPAVVLKAVNAAGATGTFSGPEIQGATNALMGKMKPYADGGPVAESAPVAPESPSAIPAQSPPQAAGVPIYDISGTTPILGDMHPDDVHEAVASGHYSLPKGSSVPVFSPDGQLGDIPAEDAPNAFQSGYKYATPDAIEQHHYESTGQQAATIAEGLVSGVISRPITSAIEQATGITTGKDILARQKYNPYEAGGAEAVGLVGGALTGTGEAVALEKAGALVAKVLGPKGATTLAKIGARTISDGVQMVLYQGGNEVSRLIEGDPTQSLGAATADIGLSGLLGAGAGAVFGSVSPLWKATVGDKAGQLISDFKSRLSFLKENPNLTDALTKELTEHGGSIKQAEAAISDALEKGTTSSGEPNKWMLDDILAKKNGESSQAIEKIQEKLTKAQEAYAPSLKAMESRFGSEVEGMPIDPAKIESYIEHSSKPKGATSRKVLENYIDASKEYRSVLNDIHSKLGLEPPAPSSLDVMHSTLGKPTPGGKLADYFVKQGVEKLSGHAAGSAVGGVLGHSLGIPGAGTVGAILGERVLGPAFESIFHSVAKPLLEAATSSVAAKAAIDYAGAVAKGETLMNKAAKNLFKASGEVTTDSVIPSETARKKLDIQLQKIQSEPARLTQVGGSIGHYLPNQAAAIASTAASASNYLNSLRPKTASPFPLDSHLPADPVAQAKYNRALDIANQPLLTVKAIQQGTLTPEDVKTLHAVNPGAYQRLSEKLTTAMMDHVSKGEIVPYRTRLNLAMFLGKPLDSTMTPSGIMNAQPKPPQPQPNTPTAPASGTKHSTAKLGKMASGAKTRGQAREARENKA